MHSVAVSGIYPLFFADVTKFIARRPCKYTLSCIILLTSPCINPGKFTTKSVSMKPGRIPFILLLGTTLVAAQGRAQVIRDTIRAGAQIPFSLDVEFVQYSAYNTTAGNIIRWSTILETNLDHYDIERSSGNGNFQKMTSIPAQGSLSVAVNYSWTDNKPLKGKNIYRIRMVDTRDGSKLYTTRIVNWSDADAGPVAIAAYPNPVARGGNLSIDFQQPGTYYMRLVSLTAGQVDARSVQSDGRSTFIMPVADRVQRGEYTLIVSNGESILMQQKIFVQ